ncbi:Ectonucleoside triphosphate diphosphohydrolase 2, partial [Ophiophagus hannah]
MDLGGASTQITFETTETIESPSNQATLKLYGQHYKAFSAFFYTVDFLRSVMKRQVATPNDLKEGAEDICTTPWSELLQKGSKLESRLQNYCSMATFVSVLLTRGYSFSSTTFPSISFQQKAEDTTIGWALGYMLNLTNMIPAEEPSFRKSTGFGPWIGLILLFVAILLGSLVSIFYLLKSSKDQGVV